MLAFSFSYIMKDFGQKNGVYILDHQSLYLEQDWVEKDFQIEVLALIHDLIENRFRHEIKEFLKRKLKVCMFVRYPEECFLDKLCTGLSWSTDFLRSVSSNSLIAGELS